MPKSTGPKKITILIVAAEASSTLYAQRLLEHWKEEGIKFEAFGIGSRAMEKLGFECIGRAEDLAVVGIQEVLSNIKPIFKTFYDLVSAVQKRKPQVVLLLDYPDFNLRLAKKLHGLPDKTFKIFYYVSPQVWAWRKSRVHLIKKIIDKMLVLFPFEKDFYQKFGVGVDFVGHPLLDEISRPPIDKGRFGIETNKVVLGLMPGSRKSEIKHHLATQLETANHLIKSNPSIAIVLLVAPTLNFDDFRPFIQELDFKVTMIQRDPIEMVGLCDVLLVASGTATLLVGLMQKPMAIMYKMNRLTVWIAQWIIEKPRFFGMVNLILGKEVAPEFFQDEANAENMARELEPLLRDANLRKKKREELKAVAEKLGHKGATARVSSIILAEQKVSDGI